jgi:CheY-like chemotaxis protein
MSTTQRETPRLDPGGLFQGFQDLMPYRVQDILLVSSLYDSFTLQEDGRLNELILGEFLELSLHHTPGLTHVSSGAEALERAQDERRFNLIITTINLGDMDASQLAREVKQRGLDAPVVVLAYDNNERKEFVARRDTSDIERIFMWQGNARILVAIVSTSRTSATSRTTPPRSGSGDPAGRGQRPLLLVVPAHHLHRADPSIRTADQRGVNLSTSWCGCAPSQILLSSTFEEAWELFTATSLTCWVSSPTWSFRAAGR